MGEVDAALSVVLEQLPAVVWRTDRDLRITESAGAGLRAIDLDPRRLQGMTLQDLFETDDPRHEAIAAHRRALAGEQSSYEVEFASRLFHAHVEPARSEDGGIEGVVGVALDVTERAQAEQELRRTHLLLESLIEGSPTAIVAIDPGSRVTLWNPAAERMFGWRREEILGRPLPIVPEDRRDEVTALIESGLRGEVINGVESQRKRKDGSIVDVRESRAPIRDGDEIVGVMGMFIDVTEQTRAQKALEHSERRYRELFENAIDFVYTHDLDGNFTSVNRAGERITGYARQELLAMNLADLVAPQDGERAREVIEGEKEQGEPLAELEVIAKDGHHILLEVNSRRVFQGGVPVEVHGIARDISEWKLAAQALERSERHFRSLIDNALDMIVVLDPDLRIRYGSPSVERVLGYRPQELVGTSVMDLIHDDDARKVVDSIDQGVREPGFTRAVTVRILHRDGAWRVIEGIGENLIHDPAVGGVVVNARDITDRTRAEEGLHRSLGVLRKTDEERRRLLAHLVSAQEEERSRIAADIHDDSLQVMAAVGMRLEVVAARLSDSAAREEVQRLYETVSLSVQRLRQLLFDVRPPSLDREGIAAALRLRLSQLRIETGVAWELHSGLGTEPPDALRTILYRIALEALTNVRKHARASRVLVRLDEEGGGIRMRIIDDGAGVSAERMQDMTGHLGVVTMRQRAELAGGRFDLETAPGRGTTVDAWIPLTPGTASIAS